jgi:hypothetical protein
MTNIFVFPIFTCSVTRLMNQQTLSSLSFYSDMSEWKVYELNERKSTPAAAQRRRERQQKRQDDGAAEHHPGRRAVARYFPNLEKVSLCVNIILTSF